MNKKKIIALIALLAIFGVTIFFFLAKNKEEKKEIVIETDNIPKAILYALAGKQKPDGFFPYEFNFMEEKYSKTDNIIHQAEIALSMLDYLEKNKNDTTVKASLNALLNGLSQKLKGGKYGIQISFFENDNDNYENLSYEEQIQKDKELRAEIAASALTSAAMTRYRTLFSELDFATSESVLIDTMLKISNLLNEQKNITDSLFKYPSYEIWYAVSVYNHAMPGNKEIKKILRKLDKFFSSVEGRIKNNSSLLYFLKTFLIRHDDEKSLYTAGAAVRNIRFFFNEYDNNYDSSVLGCLNTNILKKTLEIIETINVDTHKHKFISERISIALNDDKNFLIKANQEWLPLGGGKTLNSAEIKKFAGFFVSGYDNPFTTVSNSSACFEAFSEEEQ